MKINNAYALAVRDQDNSEDTYRIWQDRLAEARQLVRNISQRQETLLRVASLIVKKQKEFFSQGPEKMRPMVLREIAEEL
ncbi:MAG: RNA polymerase sigma-54 factor, partial [Burkholderiales bacterium]|nr:RNA polymerase sigma-54 factor [Burkholderiales bacterium]